jgi:hypothetical protein
MIQTFSPLRGLAAAIALSLVGLAVTAWLAWNDAIRSLRSHKVLTSAANGDELGSALTSQITRYALALLFVHIVVGFVAHAMTIATETALSRPARRRSVLTCGWLTLIYAWAFAANAAAFPASEFAVAPWTLAAQKILGVSAADACSVALAAVGSFVLLVAAQRSLGTRRMAAISGTVIACTAASCAVFATPDAQTAAVRYDRPHVILVGIDSLRCDVAITGASRPLAPSIERFISQSALMTDTVSPLARTFPAWASILTGRHPVATGARFNLMPRDQVHEGDTLADALRAVGYRSVYATDEVRFANIDESYGFEQSITPPIGAGDFLLGTVNDLPFSNLLANTRLGALLFPHTHANRAASVTYDPDTFVRRVEKELEVSGPTFLAVHLTLAHWPYAWAGHPTPTTPPEFREAYPRAVSAVDKQFNSVMNVLARKGLLENAIVVLLSDHGEALGYQSDSYLRGFSDPDSVWNSLWGHGTSVVSPHQFGVVLAFRRFGDPLPTEGHRLGVPASLEDIRPTILDLLGARPTEQRVDGLSLRSTLMGKADDRLPRRIRFTETDFNTKMVLQGKYDRDGLLKEGAEYYRIEPHTGRIELREERIPELLVQKERAAISATHLLAAIPKSAPNAGTEFLLIDRHRAMPERLHGRPSAESSPEGARLWDALQERFGSEL